MTLCYAGIEVEVEYFSPSTIGEVIRYGKNLQFIATFQYCYLYNEYIYVEAGKRPHVWLHRYGLEEFMNREAIYGTCKENKYGFADTLEEEIKGGWLDRSTYLIGIAIPKKLPSECFYLIVDSASISPKSEDAWLIEQDIENYSDGLLERLIGEPEDYFYTHLGTVDETKLNEPSAQQELLSRIKGSAELLAALN